MAKIIDTGIVTLYECDGGGKPVPFHRIDAREALAHPSRRWSTTPPDGNEKTGVETVGDAQPLVGVESDDGATMLLKGTEFKTRRTMARKANIKEYQKMTKKQLIEALVETQ